MFIPASIFAKNMGLDPHSVSSPFWETNICPEFKGSWFNLRPFLTWMPNMMPFGYSSFSRISVFKLCAFLILNS